MTTSPEVVIADIIILIIQYTKSLLAANSDSLLLFFMLDNGHCQRTN